MVKDYFNALYSYCPDDQFCIRLIQCPFLTPNDEENCTGCPSGQIRCDCNQEGNFTCEMTSATGGKRVCYESWRKCFEEYLIASKF